MRVYRSQQRRWELVVVDRRERHTLQLCPGIRCRDGDGEDCWRLAVLSLDGERACGGRQAAFDTEKFTSPGVIWRPVRAEGSLRPSGQHRPLHIVSKVHVAIQSSG